MSVEQYMDEHGNIITKEGMKLIQKKLIKQLRSKELLDKFYNGTLKVEPAAYDISGGWCSMSDLKNYPEVIERLDYRMLTGYGENFTNHAGIFFEDKPISIKQLIEWDYPGLSDDEEEYSWDDVIEKHFSGKKVEPPVMVVLTRGTDGSQKEIRFTLEYAEIELGYLAEQASPLKLILKGPMENGKYAETAIDVLGGDVALTDFYGVDLGTILLLSDIDMSFPLMRLQLDYVDYAEGEKLSLDDAQRGRMLPNDLNALYFEVFPFYKRGYSWSKTVDCHELANTINSKLSVNNVLEMQDEVTIYKLYMNGDTPEIMDCFRKNVISQKDHEWFFTILIKGLQKINKNIGVAYIVLENEGKLEGKLRYRKDEKTGEYVVTLW
jgi:hypothetical protein